MGVAEKSIIWRYRIYGFLGGGFLGCIIGIITAGISTVEKSEMLINMFKSGLFFGFIFAIVGLYFFGGLKAGLTGTNGLDDSGSGDFGD